MKIGSRVRVKCMYSNKASQGKDFEMNELGTVLAFTDFDTAIIKFDNPVADWHTEETFKHWIDWQNLDPSDMGYVDEIHIDALTEVIGE